ncbi:MAG: hypothetical protein IKO35_06960 [Elusimicrobiaceae bacterium]|nr:hypothetical protein [Elusimicrobiaceae bacterium]
MKRILYIYLIGIVTLLSSSVAWAQIPEKVAEVATKTTKLNKLDNLGYRITETYQKLLKQQRNILGTLSGSRLDQLKNLQVPTISDALFAFPKNLNLRELYPYASERLTNNSFPEYFLTRNNLETRRLIEQEVAKSQRVAALAEGNALDEINIGNSVPRAEESRWLVSQLKEDTQYLMIGTESESVSVHTAVVDLIKEVRVAYPEREIFLFTEEGALDGYSLNNSKSAAAKENPVLDTALAENISVVELNPLPFGEGEIWKTIEGTRLVNGEWLKTIRQFRQNHPDALFIVQASRDRVSYDGVFSLGNSLAKEGTFVVEFGKNPFDRMTEHVDRSNLKDFLHFDDEDLYNVLANAVSGNQSIIQEVLALRKKANRVLRIKDPEAARLFGFDARIYKRGRTSAKK